MDQSFEVGDIVVGKPDNGYEVTSEGSVCKVLTILDLDSMRVEVLESQKNEYVGLSYWVDQCRFSLHQSCLKVEPISPEDFDKLLRVP